MKLDKKDIKFLVTNLKNNTLLSKLNSFTINEIEGNDRQFVAFDEKELDLLEDELSLLLWEIGISENDQLNAQGYYIENLIDLVRNEYED